MSFTDHICLPAEGFYILSVCTTIEVIRQGSVDVLRSSLKEVGLYRDKLLTDESKHCIEKMNITGIPNLIPKPDFT